MEKKHVMLKEGGMGKYMWAFFKLVLPNLFIHNLELFEKKMFKNEIRGKRFVSVSTLIK